MKQKVFRTIPRILRVNAREGYVLSCLFSNGEHRLIDFKVLFRDVFKLRSGQVGYSLLEDEAAFAKAEVIENNLRWPEVGLHSVDEEGQSVFYPYELDPIILYENSKPDTTRDLDISLMIKNLRVEAGLTQSELAERSGTTKQYISRLENRHADIELRTLKRIIEGGLGKHMEIRVR